MTEQKHTPGPWEWLGQTLESRAGHDACRGFADYDEVLVCEVKCVPYCSGGSPKLRVSEANARLIAAAPDLLDALRLARAVVAESVEMHGEYPDEEAEDTVALRAIDAAIAKATGQEAQSDG